jgi:CO/xanthine dehydrogenase Mo-binding subunit
MIAQQINRRRLLQSTGLVFGFSLAGAFDRISVFAQDATPAAGGSSEESEISPLDPATRDVSGETVDSWIAIDTDGNVTLFVGKVELGTGVQTALSQIIAEELYVPFDAVTCIMADTFITPDQGTTAGSQTTQSTRPILQKAGAQARQVLLSRAADKLGVDASTLTVKDGVVSSSAGSDTVSYGELVSQPFNVPAAGDAPLKDPKDYTIVGQPVQRVDIPAKVTGGEAYVQDVRVEGMLHGRIVRPYSRPIDGLGYTIKDFDDTDAKAAPGVVAVVRNGEFVGVVAEREEQAIAAAKLLKITYNQTAPLPDYEKYFDDMLTLETDDVEITRNGDVEDALNLAVTTLESTYKFPSQAHASMGPSCAVADVREDSAIIWSPSQGVGSFGKALAPLLGLDPEKVRVIYKEGAGCYGHNGADDVGADAALLSQAVGKPVRVQWMRQDEFAWEPKGPQMVSKLRGGLDENGNIIAWSYDVWTPSHNSRPGGKPGNLIIGQQVDPPAEVTDLGQSGGDRNAAHNYSIANNNINAHWLSTAPLRPSALRSLGGLGNSTANESFMDELCVAAGADPVEFRLRHLIDPRAIDVVNKVAELSNWQPKAGGAAPSASPAAGGLLMGRGLSFTRYESELAYVAIVVDLSIDPSTGAVQPINAFVAHDCGLIVNPNGLENQIQGNVIQGLGRALKEVVTWDANGVTSLDWSSYHILTFAEVPAITVGLIDRPDKVSWGAGEITICGVAAAVNNAIYDATGVRLYEAPYTPDRILAALKGA